MKLNRNRTPQEKSIAMDFKTYYKVYLQSYLRWLYEQNNEFSDTLTPEEITNFLLNDVIHPVWFEWQCNLHTLQLIADTTTYMNRYKKHAKQMAYRFPIQLRNPNPYIVKMDTQEQWIQLETSEKEPIASLLSEDIDITRCLPISQFDDLVYKNMKVEEK